MKEKQNSRGKWVFSYLWRGAEQQAWAFFPAWSQPGHGRGGTAAEGEEAGGYALTPNEVKEFKHQHPNDAHLYCTSAFEQPLHPLSHKSWIGDELT